MSDLNQPGDDDGNQGDDLSVGEEVLDPGAPLHIGTVHEGQQTCVWWEGGEGGGHQTLLTLWRRLLCNLSVCQHVSVWLI